MGRARVYSATSMSNQGKEMSGDHNEDQLLGMPMKEGYTSTWGDKKSLCYLEGRAYANEGCAITDNPYIEGTWPWRWFNEAFMLHSDCGKA